MDKFIRIPISGTLKIRFIGTSAIIASLDIDHYASHIINHHQIQQNFRDEPNKYQFNNGNTSTQTLNMLMNALIESQNPSDFTAEFLLIFRHAMKFVYLVWIRRDVIINEQSNDRIEHHSLVGFIVRLMGKFIFISLNCCNSHRQHADKRINKHTFMHSFHWA